MDSRTAFKYEFLKTCACQGLTLSETLDRAKAALDRLEKRANPVAASGAAGAIASGLKGIFIDTPSRLMSASLPTLLSLGALTAVGVPVAAGMIGGRTLASVQDDDTNVDVAKARELAMEYKRQADAVRQMTEADQKLRGLK